MVETLKKIRTLLVGQGIPIFGTAASKLMEDEDVNYRCSDILPSARSLLCIGLPFPKGVFYTGRNTNETYWRATNIYYRNLDMVLLRIARLIEEKGEVAVPIFG
jgi:epoxyqueuosine reductase QueG